MSRRRGGGRQKGQRKKPSRQRSGKQCDLERRRHRSTCAHRQCRFKATRSRTLNARARFDSFSAAFFFLPFSLFSLSHSLPLSRFPFPILAFSRFLVLVQFFFSPPCASTLFVRYILAARGGRGQWGGGRQNGEGAIACLDRSGASSRRAGGGTRVVRRNSAEERSRPQRCPAARAGRLEPSGRAGRAAASAVRVQVDKPALGSTRDRALGRAGRQRGVWFRFRGCLVGGGAAYWTNFLYPVMMTSSDGVVSLTLGQASPAVSQAWKRGRAATRPAKSTWR